MTEPTESSHESVHVLMGRVLADLPSIGKDDEAPSSMGGYRFRGIESITSALKPLLGRHGLFMVPETIERVESGRAIGNNRTMYVVDVHVRWTFYGPGGDALTCSTWGEGTDMGDKATQKAYTSAFKSMLAVAFCIADSETDAERHDVPESGRETKIKWADWEELKLLYERATALPEAGKQLLRTRWKETPALADYAIGRDIPAELVPLFRSFLEAAEAEGRASPDTPQTAAAAPESDGASSDGGEPPAGSANGSQQPVGIDAEVVRAVTDEVAALEMGDVDERLRLWSLPKTGNREVRRQRLVKAMVTDRVKS